MSRSPTTLTIGRVAQQAGVHVETLRYYQRIGLLEQPPRPAQGFRLYPQEAVTRVRFIKRAQELGFSLKEIAGLLSLDDDNCARARGMAEQKRDAIGQRIRDLRRLHSALDEMVQACHRSASAQAPCPLIETLAGKN